MSMDNNKDSNNNNTPPKTKTELLTTGSWRLSTATVNGTDASGMIQACQRDNVLVFAAAGTGNANEGATKCNAGDPDNIPFTWNFASSETILHVSTALITSGSNDLVLESLSSTQLVVTEAYSPGPGPTYNIKMTFIH